jgi:hypothetical protein
MTGGCMSEMSDTGMKEFDKVTEAWSGSSDVVFSYWMKQTGTSTTGPQRSGHRQNSRKTLFSLEGSESMLAMYVPYLLCKNIQYIPNFCE